MKKLFAIGIGGSVKQANIEVHDVQFIIADSIEDTYETLKANWYGDSLHIDEYGIVEGVDGYRFAFERHPYEGEEQLYFVNLGGCKNGVYGELHQFAIYAAKNEAEAGEKGSKNLLKAADDSHVDNLSKLETLLKSADGTVYHIHLIPDENEYTLKTDWNGYMKLV